MAKPIIRSFHPPRVPELTPKRIIIYGVEFELAATVTVDGVAPASTTNVSTTEIHIEVAGSITFGEKDIQITNPSDGKTSDAIPYLFYSEQSAGGRYRSNPIINQRPQPLDVSFKGRTDTQQISAGEDFTGTLPENADGSPGARGGIWMYNNEVQITRIEFNSAAAEARTAPSGFYLVDRLGLETKLLDLEASLSDVALTDPFLLPKGEYIKCVTNAATQAMTAKVTHHAFSRRNR